MSSDPNKKSPRSFQCRDVLWETFEQMARELQCSVDYLVNESMKQYARQRNYGVRTPYPSEPPPHVQPAQPAPHYASQPQSPPFGAPPYGAPQHNPYGQPPPLQAAGHLGGMPRPSDPGNPVHGSPGIGTLQSNGGGRPPLAPGRNGPGSALQGRGGPGLAPRASQVPALPNAPRMPPPPPGPRSAPPPIPRNPGLVSQSGPGFSPKSFPNAGPNGPSNYANAASNQPGATLSIVYGSDKVAVSKERFVIGRGRQSSDFTLRDPNVSRQHAMIEFQNGVYFMVDMGSTNGVEFNGQRIARKQIAEGDVFRICEHDVRFTYR